MGIHLQGSTPHTGLDPTSTVSLTILAIGYWPINMLLNEYERQIFAVYKIPASSDEFSWSFHPRVLCQEVCFYCRKNSRTSSTFYGKKRRKLSPYWTTRRSEWCCVRSVSVWCSGLCVRCLVKHQGERTTVSSVLGLPGSLCSPGDITVLLNFSLLYLPWLAAVMNLINII